MLTWLQFGDLHASEADGWERLLGYGQRTEFELNFGEGLRRLG